MSTRESALSSLRTLGLDPYPARCQRTAVVSALEHLILERPDLGAGVPTSPQECAHRSPIWLAGRIESKDAHRLCLSDASGRRWLPIAAMGASRNLVQSSTVSPLPIQELWPLLHEGDLVQLALCNQNNVDWVVTHGILLAKALRPPSETLRSATGATLSTLVQRGQLIRGIRRYFDSEGFLEVETPTLALYGGLEPHLDPFETHYRSTPLERGRPAYLLTSPEYAMKQLVVAGTERVFQLTRAYRNGEVGPLHNPEFSILEWYRAYASYLDIMEDLERLVLALMPERPASLRTREVSPSMLTWQGHQVDLTPPWPRLTVAEAFIRFAGIELSHMSTAESFRAAALAAGMEIPGGASWEEIYFRVLLERIEPSLGFDHPVFLLDYPPQFASLAKVRADSPPVAERFELYIAGIELGNAYTELNDPAAQVQRFLEEQTQREAMGFPVLQFDPGYVRALETGLPPCGGIAVGVDRLLMLLLDLPTIRHIQAFPFDI